MVFKLWQHETKLITDLTVPGKKDIDLSFLHPISTLLIVIRDEGNMTDDSGKGYSYRW